MKNFSPIFFALLLLCSCDMGNGNGNKPPEENKPPFGSFGWRKAGLEPDEGTSFSIRIAISHFGEYIFVKNFKYLDKYYENNMKDIYSDFIFYSKQGSMAWSKLKVPEKAIPSAIYADTGGLYVGMRETGQLWNYNPYTEIWTDLKVPVLKEGLNVYGITRLDGKLVISMSDYKVWYSVDTNTVALVLMQDDDGLWENITPSEDIMLREPLIFRKAKEWQGNLFVVLSDGSLNGFWKFNLKSREWARMPCPASPVGNNNESLPPFALEVFDGKLYAGFARWRGVYTLEEDMNTWTRIDSVRKSLYIQKNEDSKWKLVELSEYPDYERYYDYQICDEFNVPAYAEDFATNGKDLFFVGTSESYPGFSTERSGVPMLYTGNRGEPKGWRRIHYRGGWEIGGGPSAIPSIPRSLGQYTYGLDIVNDTLYAANKNGIYKFPLSDLDSGIVNEYPYPYYCMDNYLDSLPEGYIIDSDKLANY